MLILKRLAVWLLETSCEALLLSVLLIVLSVPDGPSQAGFLKDLGFFVVATVYVFMWHSGCLVTTVIVRSFGGVRDCGYTQPLRPYSS